MNYKRVLTILICTLMLMLTASCSKDDDDNNKETVTMGTDTAPSWAVTTRTYSEVTEAPDWTITSDVDKSSSMTITCQVTTNDVKIGIHDDDYVAAFLGDVCVGKATPIATDYYGTEFFLYINGILNQNLSNTNVVVKYYSSSTKRVYSWTLSDVTFTKDAIVGNTNEPYKLDLGSASAGSYAQTFCVELPSVINDNVSSKDECAVFVGDECRATRNNSLYVFDVQSFFQLIPSAADELEAAGLKEGNNYVFARVLLRSQDEQIQVKYYSEKLSRIFIFNAFDANKYADDDIIYGEELGYK